MTTNGQGEGERRHTGEKTLSGGMEMQRRDQMRVLFEVKTLGWGDGLKEVRGRKESRVLLMWFRPLSR